MRCAVVGLACVLALSAFVWPNPRDIDAVLLARPVQEPPAREPRVVFVPPQDTLRFVWIRPGSFQMGSDLDEPMGPLDRDTTASGIDHERQHDVILTRGFWLATTETTWSVWNAVMGTSGGRGGPQAPARNLSWDDTQRFFPRLSGAATDSTDSVLRFRLPTEAEWEYAARAGTTSPWSHGFDEDSLTAYAWIRSNAAGRVQPVATRKPNPWGLYDMHGNVWEWVADWYADDAYATTPRIDPRGPERGRERVRRGGSVVYGAAIARSASRYRNPPDRGNGNLGFRIVLIEERTP
ncbi:MAG: formylglycine-generating enzyme family protein [Bacteroidota bacterium]